MNNSKSRDLLGAALDMLVRGYEEELNLYSDVRDLTARQQTELCERHDAQSFRDMLAEKESLLRFIGRIEEQLAPAKVIAMTRRMNGHPSRVKLTALLDAVTDVIEETREMERENVQMLEGAGV